MTEKTEFKRHILPGEYYMLKRELKAVFLECGIDDLIRSGELKTN